MLVLITALKYHKGLSLFWIPPITRENVESDVWYEWKAGMESNEANWNIVEILFIIVIPGKYLLSKRCY